MRMTAQVTAALIIVVLIVVVAMLYSRQLTQLAIKNER